MKIPLSWLRQYVDITLGPRELAHRLTMAGVEVGGVTTIGGSWEHVYVGHVVSVDPHPNADRLTLATVDLGQERHTVVCGAPNIAPGQRVPFAKEGARLFDSRTGALSTLKAAKIRGVVSAGMVCSERELGLGEDHTGIVVLAQDAPLGTPLADYLGDAILDVEVTPNRPDCLSLLGIAWEVAALTGATVRMPDLSYPEEGPPIAEQVTIRVDDPELAPRYTASLILGVQVGPSPQWMQDRLLKAGQRPINNVVDITNFVMLELGQPLHAFDYHTLAEKTIIVRQAWAGEVLVTLDGQERKLDPPMLVIADAQRSVGLAGIIGGGNTEVTEQTTAVLLEAANFDPASNRRTAAAHKLRTEASLRFEKGLNPALAEKGLRRATGLIVEIAGGRVAKGIVDIYPHTRESTAVRLTQRRIHQVLGVEFGQPQVERVLTSLGFQCGPASPGAGGGKDAALWATPPFWRSDIAIEDDLVEEVARIVGYDAIPTVMPSGSIPHGQPQPLRELREQVMNILASCGMQEIISYSLVSRAVLEKVSMSPDGPEPLRAANPMSPEQEYLRTTLRGGVLATMAANQRHAPGGLRLFEAGRVYLPRGRDLPHEKEMVVGVFAGPRDEIAWLAEPGAMDFFDAKGVVEALLGQVEVRGDFRPHRDALLHPGRCAQVRVQGTPVGVVGEVHPVALERFEIAAPVVALFELDMEALLGVLPPDSQRYRPMPRFPEAVRDMALVVDRGVPAERLLAIVEAHPLVVGAALFDVYSGEGVPQGKRSLAYRITYRSPRGTLTTQEINRAQEEILESLTRETGATLRV